MASREVQRLVQAQYYSPEMSVYSAASLSDDQASLSVGACLICRSRILLRQQTIQLPDQHLHPLYPETAAVLFGLRQTAVHPSRPAGITLLSTHRDMKRMLEGRVTFPDAAAMADLQHLLQQEQLESRPPVFVDYLPRQWRKMNPFYRRAVEAAASAWKQDTGGGWKEERLFG
ncbi:hypothetical protein ALCH109712_07110 [Alkalicoccus chagannorensis]